MAHVRDADRLFGSRRSRKPLYFNGDLFFPVCPTQSIQGIDSAAGTKDARPEGPATAPGQPWGKASAPMAGSASQGASGELRNCVWIAEGRFSQYYLR